MSEHGKCSKEVAISKLKERFIRVSSVNGYPQFIDLETGIRQADTYILSSFYNSLEPNSTEPSELINKLDVCYGEVFLPNQERLVKGGYLNLWKPPILKASGEEVLQDQIPLFDELLKRWFPEDIERQYFCWWLAHCVRKPEERIVSTLLLRSEQGIGKGFLVETLLHSLLGSLSVATCSIDDVTGDFNDVLEGKTLILLDEVYSCSGRKLNTLKSLQGNKTFALKRKFKPVVNINNHINFLMATNQKKPFKIEYGDRRYWIPQFMVHKESVSETSKFINQELKPWLLKENGLQLVRDWFEGIDLKGYFANSAPPMTESKSLLMGFNNDDRLNALVKKAITERPVVSVQQLAKDIEVVMPQVSETSISRTLKALDCVNKRLSQRRVWITPNGLSIGLSNKSSPKEIELHIS